MFPPAYSPSFTPNFHLELFTPLGVGWREDATSGVALDQNFAIIDAALASGGSSVYVNAAKVATPNFKNSATVTFSVVGSDVTAAAFSGAYADLTGKPSLATVATSGSYADLSSKPSIPTSFTWDVEGNAAGNLSINNAGYTSTFNQTSAVNWTWANTTVGTISSTNASPLLNLAANYWATGAVTGVDSWSLGIAALTAGLNSPSTLTFAHTGSTGVAAVRVPQLDIGGTDAGISRLGAGSLAIGNGTAGDYSGNLKLAELITSPLAGNGDVQLRLTNNESGTYGDDLFTIDSEPINTNATIPKRYSGNVSVTNGSRTVTAVSGTFEYYPGGAYSDSPWTGMVCTIGGVQYKMAVVTSSSTLSLTKPYAGVTNGSVAMTVVFDADDLYDHVMQWGYNQNGSGGYDNPALQFGYHWALESNWAGQANHDAVMERHQALSLSGMTGGWEKRTAYGQGWKTGYSKAPGYFQDYKAKDLDVWQQSFVFDVLSVSVAGGIATITISNPNPSQLFSTQANVEFNSDFTAATFLNGNAYILLNVLSNGFTIAVAGHDGFSSADYGTGLVLGNYMYTSPSGLVHRGNLTSAQSVIAGAVSLAGYANNLGPGPTNTYYTSVLATAYYDTSGGALPPVCGHSGDIFGIGSTYIINNGRKFDCVGVNTWQLAGTSALHAIGGYDGAGFYTNSVDAGIQPDVDLRPGSSSGLGIYSSWTTETDNAGFLLSSFGLNGAAYYAIAYNHGSSHPLTDLHLGAWSGIKLHLYDGANQIITGDGSGNPVYKWNADTSLSRIGAASLAIGNGTAGDFSGSLELTTVNAMTGYQVKGTATSGHVLRGDGVNFVDAQLDYSDLSGTPQLAQTATRTANSFFTSYNASTGVFGQSTIALVDLPSGYNAWSNLGNATGALTLANGTNATTFNQTSAAAWSWANTTIASNVTTNASPTVNLAANYWTGAASAADTWTIGSSLAAGTNGASTLTIGHSGSTGALLISTPATLIAANGTATVPAYSFSGESNSGMYRSSGGFTVIATNGASVFAVGGTNVRVGSNGLYGFTNASGDATGSIDGGISRLGAASLAIGNGTAGDFTGALKLASVNALSTSAATSGNTTNLTVNPTLSPTAGTATLNPVLINPTINQAALTNTIVGTEVIANVAAVVFTTANTWTNGSTTDTVAAVTKTSVNGVQNITTTTTVSRAAITVTNIIETAGSVVTLLTAATNGLAVNDYIYISGMTAGFGDWMNGYCAKITAVTANVSFAFTDPVAGHNPTSTHATSGTVLSSYIKYTTGASAFALTQDTGTATQQAIGNYTGLKIAAVETSLGGTANKLIDCYAGSAGTTPMFSVDNLGAVYLSAAAASAPTSTGTAGTIGQILRYGGVLYFCSASGVAGAATWNKLSMTAV